MNNQFKAHISLFVANFLYGINYVIVKSIMPEYINAPALTFLRNFLSTILFWIFCMFIESKVIDKKDYPRFFWAALLGVSLNQFLFVQGLDYTTPMNAAIIMTTNPILVLIAASIMLRERIVGIKILGILLGAIGALIAIMSNGPINIGSQTAFGDGLMFLNSLSFALYLTVSKPLMGKYHTMQALKWFFLIGSLLLLPLGIKYVDLNSLLHLPAKVYLALTYIIVVTTFLTYIMFNFSLKHLNASTVSIYLYMQPVVAGLTAYFLGMEKITILKIVATVLVFSGVYIVSKLGNKI